LTEFLICAEIQGVHSLEGKGGLLKARSWLRKRSEWQTKKSRYNQL